tara:strand:- start:2913 stop:3944 length:1032 start_codon:yes stop_codon:yes gene_type:complete
MIKIKLYELDKHRNECAYRPYLAAQNTLHDIGIQFTTGDSYDYAWIAQDSFINKKVSLQESVDTGLNFLSKISGDYMLLDAQDSTSLMGSYEVFKQSNALLMMKNSLLRDKSLYKTGLNLGRYYWGPGDYKLDDFDEHSDKIVLSGTNWLSTHWSGIKVQWHDIQRPRNYDISAMFGYPSPASYEHLQLQSGYYNESRKPSIEIIDKLSSKFNIAKLINGQRVSIQEYHQKMFESKVIFTPMGYGSLFPRDLEAAMYGCILIKPDMSFNDTTPDVFIDGETYIACKHDFSDLEEKFLEILGNYENYHYIINNMREKFKQEMAPQKLATHLHNMFSQLTNIDTE